MLFKIMYYFYKKTSVTTVKNLMMALRTSTK